MDQTSKSRATITRLIKKLKETGKLQRIGSDKKGYWEITEDKSNSVTTGDTNYLGKRGGKN